tara:strand:+ start:692 stop:1288 length:597 start_codon:yes stop_codon:yes gene_type:complete
MSSSDVLGYILIIFVIIICFKMYMESDYLHLNCVVSTVDGNKYCVRDGKRVKEAANLMAKVVNKCEKLVEYMVKTYPADERIKRLKAGFNPTRIMETLPTSELTAYSENKGEKIALCLRKKNKENSSLIDLNTLTFVAIHELSHIMTLSIGHEPEFWENFKFLLINAETIKIYKPVDYKKSPQPYCGIPISDNPYYDL